MGSWKKYLAAFLVNTAFTLLVLFLRGFELKIYYVDAFSVAGGISVLLALLFWVSRAGAFDTIRYGFSTLYSGRKYKDLYEYSSAKREKRDRRGGISKPFFLVGIGFLACSLLLSIL